jgi:hypothetical protein
MSDDELALDPARAHRGGLDLHHAGTTISASRSADGAAIAAASAARPWGRDDIGAAFEKNYRPVETAILAAWESTGSSMEGLGAAAVRSVERSVDTDDAAGGRIAGV